MAKLNDLEGLDEVPGQGSRSGERSEEARVFIDVIEGMRGSGKYDWCDQTLSGISETVQRSNRVSPEQRRAVVNFLKSRNEESEDYE